MRLAVSTIAWGADDFAAFLDVLRNSGCDAVEIAPSLLWTEPVTASASERLRIRRSVEGHGLTVVGLHSLFYSRPDLTLFADATARADALEYLKALVTLCRDLGGETLVFGSPSVRRRGSLSNDDAFATAIDFFQDASASAEAAGVLLLIEPLTPDETDFITSMPEGLALVRRVNHPSFGLHLDVRSIVSSSEDGLSTFATYGAHARHVHVGDPGLTPPGSTGVDHAAIGKALRQSGYDGCVSIEMRRGVEPPAPVIARSVSYVRECYLGQPE